MKWFSLKSLHGKIALSSVVILVIAFLILNFLLMPLIKDSLYSQKKDAVKSLVQSTMGICKMFYQQQQEGELSEQEAKSRAKSAIKRSVYGQKGRDYFWINDLGPTMIMHPYKPGLNGQDLSEIQDPKGTYLFNRMVEVAETKDAGFVRYHWQYYDNQDRIEPKISYVKLFEPWGWVLGTGMYITDVEESISAIRLNLAGIALGIVIFAVIALYLITKKLVRPLETLSQSALQIEAGNLEVEVPVFKQQDEVGVLSQAMHDMLKKNKEVIGYYDTILEKMGTALAWVDKDARVIKFNQAAAQLIEVEAKDQFIGEPAGLAFYNDSERTTISEKAMQQKESILGVQAELETRKGNVKQLQIDSVPLLDENGEVASVFTTLTDITEIKAQEQKFQQKSEQLGSASNRASEISSRLASASEELAAQVKESEQSIEEQQKRATEVSTAMEQMNASILEISKNASNAAEQAESTKQKADEGYKVVSKVSEYMNKVTEKTQTMHSSLNQLSENVQGINQVMDMINDIADQTNLLALNAAIEAARAGDAGKGFAVVADEVRKLAEKTMQATKEVGETINSITSGTESNVNEMNETGEAVGETKELADQASQYLLQIVELAQSNYEQVQNIATSSEEQSSASEQINRASDDVDNTAQAVANSMQQSAQAVTELNNLVQELNQIVQEMQQS